MTALDAVAHCRAGDKGGDSLLVVAPYEAHDLAQLSELLTPARVAAHFGGMAEHDVTVAAAPSLGALVVTLRGRLGGGVTRSVGIDPHGKTLSGHLLSLEVPWT